MTIVRRVQNLFRHKGNNMLDTTFEYHCPSRPLPINLLATMAPECDDPTALAAVLNEARQAGVIVITAGQRFRRDRAIESSWWAETTYQYGWIYVEHQASLIDVVNKLTQRFVRQASAERKV